MSNSSPNAAFRGRVSQGYRPGHLHDSIVRPGGALRNLTASGGHRPRGRPRRYGNVRSDASRTSRARTRDRPSSTAAAMETKAWRDSSTSSPELLTMRQRQVGSDGVENAMTCTAINVGENGGRRPLDQGP